MSELGQITLDLSSVCPSCHEGNPVEDNIVDSGTDFVFYRYVCSNKEKCDHEGNSGMMRFGWGHGKAILEWNGEKNYTDKQMLEADRNYFDNLNKEIEVLLSA